MGELTFIRSGIATTIHDDGSTSTVAAQQCDQCFKWQSTLGGIEIRDVSGMSVMWLCAECRA